MTIIFCIALFAIIVCCRCESNYTYKYFPTYHLGPLIDPNTRQGWMNDPNGFCVYKGEYHLFYQYNPVSSLVPGIAHWGHAKSKDLVNWAHLPIALYPDMKYDISGVFSGSALVENNVMYLYYTGNVNHPDHDPDHEQHQILATSTDGETFRKVTDNPIIIGNEHQPNFRDPKVWKRGDKYYMVLGNSFNNNTRGRALLYSSRDKHSWEQISVLEHSDGFLGYMWECPDFFELDGLFVLLFSPQGVKSQDDDFKNLYSTGYIVGSFDYKSNMFTEVHPYKELDHGHDFYATQSIIDKHGDRVVVAWFDMWDQDYPEGPDGFTGHMTIPRKLKLTKDGHLLQQPIREIQQAVGKRLHSGRGRAGTKVTLNNNAGKVEVSAPKTNDFTLYIGSSDGNDTVTISYSYLEGRVTLDRGGNDGVRRTRYRPKNDQLNLVVYIDSSSIEAFFGRGEVTFSSRFFPTGWVAVRVADTCYADVFIVNEMNRAVPHPTQSFE